MHTGLHFTSLLQSNFLFVSLCESFIAPTPPVQPSIPFAGRGLKRNFHQMPYRGVPSRCRYLRSITVFIVCYSIKHHEYMCMYVCVCFSCLSFLCLIVLCYYWQPRKRSQRDWMGWPSQTSQRDINNLSLPV